MGLGGALRTGSWSQRDAETPLHAAVTFALAWTMSGLPPFALCASGTEVAANDEEPGDLTFTCQRLSPPGDRFGEVIEHEAGAQRGVEVGRQHPVVGTYPPTHSVSVNRTHMPLSALGSAEVRAMAGTWKFGVTGQWPVCRTRL
jgi:hypothetical protein